MQGAEGGRVLREAAPGRQIHANSQPSHRKVQCIEVSSACCVLASIGCPPAIFLCTGTLIEALDIAPKGCRAPARAALALYEDTASVCGWDAAEMSAFDCRISLSIQATRYSKTQSPGSTVASDQYVISFMAATNWFGGLVPHLPTFDHPTTCLPGQPGARPFVIVPSCHPGCTSSSPRHREAVPWKARQRS